MRLVISFLLTLLSIFPLGFGTKRISSSSIDEGFLFKHDYFFLDFNHLSDSDIPEMIFILSSIQPRTYRNRDAAVINAVNKFQEIVKNFFRKYGLYSRHTLDSCEFYYIYFAQMMESGEFYNFIIEQAEKKWGKILNYNNYTNDNK